MLRSVLVSSTVMPWSFKLCPDFLLEAAEFRPSLGGDDGGAGEAESDLILGEGGHSKPGGGEREVGEGGIGEDGVGEEVEGGGCRSGLGDLAAGGGGDMLMLAAARAGEEVGVFAGEPTVEESCTW